MSYPGIIEFLNEAHEYPLSFKKKIGVFSVSGVTTSGGNFKATVSEAVSSVRVRQFIYFEYGPNEGYHEIASVGSGTIDFKNGVVDSEASTAIIYEVKTKTIESVISQQIASLEKVVGFSFVEIQTFEETLDGTGREDLLVSRRFVREIVNIKLLNLPNQVLSIPTSAIEVITNRGTLRVRAINLEAYTMVAPIWPQGRNNIKITYTAGFDECPEDVSRAIILMALSNMLGKEASYSGGGTSLSVTAWSKTFGPRGKYSEARNDYVIQARAIVSKYKTGVVSS
ncbi:hypothetical protein [Leptospira phage LE4]|uniref:Uncharacterized protein n=1 Tax=Leptospira phage LE4 TaxID=2041383 RepID=A0A343LED0_9CAUD|nr:hypothetical protein HWB34_gp27 [Leptospira phage LE4]ATN95040.1 hypothetical protein [Leptospira phage LE4]